MVSRENLERVLECLRARLLACGTEMELITVDGDRATVRVTGVSGNGESCSADTSVISLDDQLRDVEAHLIGRALHATNGNKSRAAELLHIKRTTLTDRINRLGPRLLKDEATDGAISVGTEMGAR